MENAQFGNIADGLVDLGHHVLDRFHHVVRRSDDQGIAAFIGDGDDTCVGRSGGGGARTRASAPAPAPASTALSALSPSEPAKTSEPTKAPGLATIAALLLGRCE